MDNVEPAERPAAPPGSYSRQGTPSGAQPASDAASQGQDAAPGGPSQRDGDPDRGYPAGRAGGRNAGRDAGTSSGEAPDDEAGWGRPARAPAEDWGWPEASASSGAAEDAWEGAEAGPSSRGYADRDAGAAEAAGRNGEGGWRDANGGRSGWDANGEPPRDDWDSEAVPDITLLTPQERVRPPARNHPDHLCFLGHLLKLLSATVYINTEAHERVSSPGS